jgi:hypothetical protein
MGNSPYYIHEIIAWFDRYLCRDDPHSCPPGASPSL